MRALIVEDDPTLSAQLAEAMAGAGFVTDRAADGTEGEYLGATESYDVAILDLGLPGLSGLEVLTRWRDQESFEAWMASPAFGHGHRDASERSGGEAKPPVSIASEVWSFTPAGGSTPTEG